MIRRVYANQHGIITLDSDMFGSRKRISTGKKADKRLLKWYEKNFDTEYRELFEEKYQPKKEDYSDLTLREYGVMVLDLTSENRRQYVHERIKKTFRLICDFEMSDSKKFGEFLLTDIKTTHVMKWQRESGLSPQTVSTNRAYLNIVLQTAMNDDIIRKNPVTLVKLPKKHSVKGRVYYTEDEIKKILESAKGQLKNYIQIAFFTGMRGSELVGLKWDDIDFDKEMIRVDSRIVRGVEDETKSRKIRFVPMFKQCKEALLKQRMYSGLKEFVFINQSGNSYYGSQTMNFRFKKLLSDNNLRHGTVHDLRRSFNTILKEYGYPTDWILDIMGHVDDRVNRNHYTGKLRVDATKVNNIAI